MTRKNWEDRANGPDLNLTKYGTTAEIKTRMEEIHEEAGDRALDPHEQREWDALKERHGKFAEMERCAAAGYLEGGAHGMRSCSRTRTGRPYYDEAMRHVEDATRNGIALPASAAERIENLMRAGETSPIPDSFAEKAVAAASDPAYLAAFMKAISGERGTLLWTPQEAEAYRRVEAVRAEMRGMQAGVNASGGFQIPTVIDPSIRISSDGSISPMRQLADVRQVVGTTFRAVTSAQVTNQWTAESTEVPDNSPTLAAPEIKAFKSTSFVPFSFEYATSQTFDLVADLTRLLVDGLDQLTNQAFLDGNGTTAPQGLWTGLDGTASELSPAVAETFNANVDVYTVQNALGARWQPNATWLMDLATINKVSEAETTNGAARFGRVGDAEPVLLRKPVAEWSNMRSVSDIAPAQTADNPIIFYGDIRSTYTIVDFFPSTVELVPHLFGANRRPTGERGLLLWSRTGGGVIIAGASRVLNVATTA